MVVATTQEDTTHGRGVHRAVDPGDDNVYVWTTFEPDEARYAWACFDQPDLKAPHAFTVTAPAASYVDRTAGLLTRYNYRVSATRGTWTSTTSNVATITTTGFC